MSRVIAATIRGGHAVAEELTTLPEGSAVEVVLDDDAERELTPGELAELDAAHEQADRGRLVSAADVLDQLARRRHPGA